jgi:hypothetical protein
MAIKKKHVTPFRTVIQNFLKSIISSGSKNIRMVAMMKKNELDATPQGMKLPARFNLLHLAVDITNASKVEEEEDTTFANQEASLYKSTAIANKTIITMPANDDNDFQWNGPIQGYTRPAYYINEMYRPNKSFTPKRKPIPDLVRDQRKKRQSLYDPTISCNACFMTGHPAFRCHSLAIAVRIYKFLENSDNQEVCEQALKHWEERNKKLLCDPKTNKTLELSPMQILRTYTDRYGYDINTINDGLEWHQFECADANDEVECREILGISWETLNGYN